MNNRKWNRILRLADFMEKLPKERFYFGSFAGDNWAGKPDLSCGTTACAIGWATTIPYFRRLGLYLQKDEWLNVAVVKGANWSSGGLFGVSQDVLDLLFFPDDAFPDDEPGSLPRDATPKQWARHARKIVKQLQKGEIE